MPVSDGGVRRVLRELAPRQRIQTWLDAMRRAGGLAFGGADALTPRAIFELEQTTPGGERWHFLRSRDAILAANAVLSWAFGADRLRAEALLAQVGGFASLLLLARSPETRQLLAEAVQERDGVEASARPQKRRSTRPQDTSSPQAIADTLAVVYGLMFEYDESDLASYWREVLTCRAIGEPFTRRADLNELLRTRGEPVSRSLRHHAAVLSTCLRRPRQLQTRLLTGLVEGFTADELTLPPADAQLTRNENVVDALNTISLGGSGARLDEDDIVPLREMVQHPRKHAQTLSVIDAYEDWLYPTKRRPYARTTQELEWEPWQDFYTNPPPWEAEREL